MTVTTYTSDRPNVSLVYIWENIQKWFSFAKKKIQLCQSTHDQLTIQLGGISLKLSPLIGVTTIAFVWKLGILTLPTLLWIVTMVAYFLMPIYTLSEKKELISDHIKGPLVAGFRSPLMKALDKSVEMLGLWIVTSSVAFIKSVN